MVNKNDSFGLDEYKKETTRLLKKALPDVTEKKRLLDEVNQAATPKAVIDVINRAILRFNLSGPLRGELESIKGIHQVEKRKP